VIVAKVNAIIVGFLALKDEWVDHLYLSPDFQGKGIGTVLLSRAKKLHPNELKLWVFEYNTGAIRLYEREGFVLVEKRDIDKADNEEKLPDRLYAWRP
jgi:GNAT superfamily N-acetyltransferase